jgi:hypothetical protein
VARGDDERIFLHLKLNIKPYPVKVCSRTSELGAKDAVTNYWTWDMTTIPPVLLVFLEQADAKPVTGEFLSPDGRDFWKSFSQRVSTGDNSLVCWFI